MIPKEVKKIVKTYKKTLENLDFPVKAMYLFGSQAKENTHEWSDIDIAVVSNRLKHDHDKDRLVLWNARMDVDLRIEPHGFTEKEFNDNANFFASEIRTTGIKIE